MLASEASSILLFPRTHDYGWFSFRPKFLQFINKPPWCLCFLGMGVFFQGFIINGLLHIDLPVIERRFNLKASSSGIICGSYDIASVIVLIPITYFGGQRNASKPRWIGTSLVLMGIGSFIFFVPELLYSNVDDEADAKPMLCQMTLVNVCQGKHEAMSFNFWIFVFSNFICGMGGCTLYTLAVTYIEEGVPLSKSPLYMGIYYILAMLGTAAGFVIGGFLLGINNNFFFKVDVKDRRFYDHTQNDPEGTHFVGAWWLGFVISSMLFFLISIPNFGFPAELPETPAIRVRKKSESHANTAGVVSEFVSVKHIPNAIFFLFRNPTFIFLTLAGCCDAAIINSTSIFMPKIMENQFQLSNKITSIVMGSAVVCGGVIGLLTGGMVLNRFDLNCSRTIKFCICCCALSTCCMFALFFHCNERAIAGLSVPYPTGSTDLDLESECNQYCNCHEELFSPVCGIDGIIYYSGCYAGCTEITYFKGFYALDNCSCIAETSDIRYQATSKTCVKYCNTLPIFISMITLALFSVFTAVVPGISATLRCVNASQKSLAMGVQWMLIRLCGVFAPFLFGHVLDLTCVFWEKKCAEPGACLLYDGDLFSRGLFIMGISVRSLGLICLTLSLITYKAPHTALATSQNAANNLNNLAGAHTT